MIGYVRLDTADLRRSAHFYDRIGAAMGVERCEAGREDAMGWGLDAGRTGLVCRAGRPGRPGGPGLGVIAFKARDRVEVIEIFRAAIERGGTSDLPPHEEASGRFIAAFRDPDGYRLSCYADRD